MEAEAKYRFAASQEDELSFEKATIVNVRTVLESFSSNEFYFARSSSIDRDCRSSCKTQLHSFYFQVLDMDSDKNWYKAEQGNREGWIPNTYITMRAHK